MADFAFWNSLKLVWSIAANEVRLLPLRGSRQRPVLVVSLGVQLYVSVVSLSSRSYDLHSAAVRAAFYDRFASRLLGYRSPLGTVVVPEATEHLSGDHLAHVHPDQSHDEHAVASQVVLRELAEGAGLARSRVHDADLLADVLDVPGPVQWPRSDHGVTTKVMDVPGPVQRAEQPAQEVDRRDAGQEDEPEPEEHKDLLVEQVDSENALDDVVVHSRLVADLEFAEGDAREPLRISPVLAADQLFHNA